LIDLSAKPELGVFGLIVSALQKEVATTFFIAGAQARDLLIEHHSGIPTGRATTDLDFGVYLDDWPAFHALRAALIDSGAFKNTEIEHRLLFGNLKVDFVPFGGVETLDNRIVWPADSMIMTTLGYREAYAACVDVLLPGRVAARVASLPTQSLLKLITWGDHNPVRLNKDAQDFQIIAKSYHRIAGDERLYGQVELFDQPSFDLEALGAFVLGQDARAELLANSGSPRVADAVVRLLRPERGPSSTFKLAAAMGGPSIEDNARLIDWYFDGLLAANGASI